MLVFSFLFPVVLYGDVNFFLCFSFFFSFVSSFSRKCFLATFKNFFRQQKQFKMFSAFSGRGGGGLVVVLLLLSSSSLLLLLFFACLGVSLLGCLFACLFHSLFVSLLVC